MTAAVCCLIMTAVAGGPTMTIYQVAIDTGSELFSAGIMDTDGRLSGSFRDDTGRTDLSIEGTHMGDRFSFSVKDEANGVYAVFDSVFTGTKLRGKMIRGKMSEDFVGAVLPSLTGFWNADMGEASFDINLYQTGAFIEGYHSSITKDALRIDASDPKGGDYSLNGSFQKNSTILLDITTAYGYSDNKEDMKGQVRITVKNPDELEWYLERSPKVEHYFPKSTVLRRYNLLTGDLSQWENRYIILDGEVTDLMAQHMITMNEAYPSINYVETSIGQLVIYSKIPLPKGKLTIWGKLIKVGGGSKRPGEGERKYYYEYQIEAHKWSK